MLHLVVMKKTSIDVIIPARPGFRKIDGHWIYTDSAMEARIIERLVKDGFSQRWHRYGFGIATSVFRYTPDVHLSILHDGMDRRALVEFKPLSVTQFKKKDRLRMLAAAKFFKDALCFLYIEKTKQWYIIEPGGLLVQTAQPIPGFLPVSELPRPRIMIPVYNRYGRMYWERPGMFMARKMADGIGFMIREVFGTPKKSRRRRR